jgi:hypothetical protein
MSCACPAYDTLTGDLIPGAAPGEGSPHLPSCPEARRAAEVARRAEMDRVHLDGRAPRSPGGWAVLPARIVCDPSLSPEARCVLLLLSAHADDNAHPYPSVATLARLLGRSERTVLRVLSELRAADLVEVIHRFRGNEQTTSAHVLRFDRWGRSGGGGVTPGSGRGDTHVTPGGDTHVTPRGDTGVVQIKTTRPAPLEENQNPPLTPPSSEGGEPGATPFTLQGDPMAPLPSETRGERVKRVKTLFGWTPREANRKVAEWDAASSPAARAAKQSQAASKREYDSMLAEEAAEAARIYAQDFGLAQ